jgi:uncharacterized protein
MAEATLQAPHTLHFPYTRSTGPVLGAFLGGLRAGKVLGVRAQDGRVLVPPQEYDPVTSADLAEMVEVGQVGTVESWSWNDDPFEGQPLGRPFAWVLVRLDGADTPMLHALDVSRPDEVSIGMRVAIRWADEREGTIHDIACFEPGEEATPATDNGSDDAIDVVTTPVTVSMTYRPAIAAEPFLRGTQRRELLGRRCSTCDKVYLPPRGVCSMCGAAFTDEQVVCGPKGTVATFLVVNVPFANQEVEIPYTAVEVLFDHAHTTSQFLLLGTPVEEVRSGMRVEAVWAEGDDLQPTLSNVTHVVAIDEPDVDYADLTDYA